MACGVHTEAGGKSSGTAFFTSPGRGRGTSAGAKAEGKGLGRTLNLQTSLSISIGSRNAMSPCEAGGAMGIIFWHRTKRLVRSRADEDERTAPKQA